VTSAVHALLGRFRAHYGHLPDAVYLLGIGPRKCLNVSLSACQDPRTVQIAPYVHLMHTVPTTNVFAFARSNFPSNAVSLDGNTEAAPDIMELVRRLLHFAEPGGSWRSRGRETLFGTVSACWWGRSLKWWRCLWTLAFMEPIVEVAVLLPLPRQAAVARFGCGQGATARTARTWRSGSRCPSASRRTTTPSSTSTRSVRTGTLLPLPLPLPGHRPLSAAITH